MTYLLTHLALAVAASFFGCLTSVSQEPSQLSLISRGFASGHLNQSAFKSRRLYWQWESGWWGGGVDTQALNWVQAIQ